LTGKEMLKLSRDDRFIQSFYRGIMICPRKIALMAVMLRNYFVHKNHYDDDNSAVRISIHSREKRASALDLTPEGDMNRALLAASLYGHFECRAFCGVSRSDI